MADQIKHTVPDDIIAAAQHLLQMAVKHNVLIIGFACSELVERPFVMPFTTGNYKEALDPRIYNGLCQLATKSLADTGAVEHIYVGRPD